jgi:multiple sugar transport system permease protein
VLSLLLGTDVHVMWLTNPTMAVCTIILLEIWNWTPFALILMLASLAALPHELVEAAESLGANRWRIFWEIQLPLLRPVILLALVLRFLEAMGEFAKTWGLLQGGPGSATETIPVYLYLTTWSFFRISKGAAMSYIVMLLMIVLVLLAIRILRREKTALDRMYSTPGQSA